MTVGSRAQVWHGTAKHTSGGLTKTQLMMNRAGRIVSRKKHHSAKKDNRLVKAGYKTKKGHFGFVKVGSRKRGHKGRKGLRGGSGGLALSSLSPAELNALGDGIAGQGITQGQNGGPGGPLTAALMAGVAIYGSDSIGANLSDAFGSSDMKNGASDDGISGAGITNFGSSSTGVQMRAGMSAGGRRRKSRGRRGRRSMGMMGGTTAPLGEFSGPNMQATMAASGGRRRKGKRSMSMYGGTGNRSHVLGSDISWGPEQMALNA